MKVSWANALLIGALVVPVGAYAQSAGNGAATSGASSASDKGTSRSIGATASDASITAKVKTELIKDKDVSAMSINVDTMNGVVTLKGTAKTRAAADKAATLARSVDGVKSVKNDIQVSAVGSPSTGASTSGSTTGSSSSPAGSSSNKSSY